jgi:hypothetical protein
MVTVSEEEYKQILIKFKSEAAHPLAFTPNAASLLDVEFCRQLEAGLRRGDGGISRSWKVRTATADLSEAGESVGIEECFGLYMFVWSPELTFSTSEKGSQRLSWVLYIGRAGSEDGSAGTIRSRYRGEYSKFVGRSPEGLWRSDDPDGSRSERLRLYLSLRPLEFWYLKMVDVRDIALYEKKLIQLLNPPVNVQLRSSRKGLRPSVTEPAF